MAVRGRKPGPPELRVIKGDKRVRGKAVAKPLAPASAEPTVPSDFDEEHAAKWNEIADMMREMGTFGREVADVLRLYVEACVEALVARRAMKAEGGAVIRSPKTSVPMHSLHRAVARQAESSMLKLAAELGLTPSSRGRIAGKAQDTGNPFTAHGRRA